ncbi:DUF397 domain-containing protein [Streptomyces sp. URMC 129]|uniref:DUF397 domain-containing protein n=1 Tax=Streptomyces sp. URMC 129 TaxID=3423407 RepID=UPI003F1CEA1A
MADHSTCSGGHGGRCVEVGSGLPGVVPVRDSKAPARAVLAVPTRSWTAFLATLRDCPPHDQVPAPTTTARAHLASVRRRGG